MKPQDDLSQFLIAFSEAVTVFGDTYEKRMGEAVNGRFLIRALIRWAAATIAAAPAEERAALLLKAISDLHTDLDAAESQQGRLN